MDKKGIFYVQKQLITFGDRKIIMPYSRCYKKIDLDNEYYAFIKYNAGLSDEGTLYKYSSNKLTKVCTLDSGKIVGLKKVK